MALAVRHFFDLEAVQLESGSLRCRIDFIATDSVLFYHENYPLRTHLRGELLGGRFGLALPVGGPPIKFAGEEMQPCRLASAMSGEEMDVYASGGLRQIVVLVDQKRLLELAGSAGLSENILSALQSGRTNMPLVAKPDSATRFAGKAMELLQGAATGMLQLGCEDIEELVYGEILSLVDVKNLPSGRPSAAVLVRRAMEIVDAQPGPLPVATLCRLLRTSPSTLECTFKKITSLTPHTFFLRRRLNRARSALLDGDRAEIRVTDIALEHGFTELGRFSVRYRQMFGESPSDTLQRHTRTTIPSMR
jgi:AraC-like DNA-binding protein